MAESVVPPRPYPRPGYGLRHPEVEAFLARATPLASEATTLPSGVRLRISGYRAVDPLPGVVVSSVRCIVRVADAVVVCTNADDVRHAWPGGRREVGETFADTACREVHEETGWYLDPVSLRQLGWLHLEHLGAVSSSHPYPHPDAFQAVFTGTAAHRDGDGEWTDTEGYELSSELVPLSEAAEAVSGDPLSASFLRILAADLATGR